MSTKVPWQGVLCCCTLTVNFVFSLDVDLFLDLMIIIWLLSWTQWNLAEFSKFRNEPWQEIAEVSFVFPKFAPWSEMLGMVAICFFDFYLNLLDFKVGGRSELPRAFFVWTSKGQNPDNKTERFSIGLSRSWNKVSTNFLTQHQENKSNHREERFKDIKLSHFQFGKLRKNLQCFVPIGMSKIDQLQKRTITTRW